MNNGSTRPADVFRRKDAEIEMRREACIDAAERLFVTKGLEATSMQDIAAAVGIAVGTLYNMFESKVELAHQVFLRKSKVEQEWMEKIVGDTSISAREALTRIIDKMITASREHQITIRASMRSMSMPLAGHKGALAAVLEHREKMLGYMKKVIERCIKEGLIRPDLDPGRIGAALIGAMMGFFAYMITYESGIPKDLSAERICGLLLSGIGRRPQDA
jgi:AcrR family transcriptional regulator